MNHNFHYNIYYNNIIGILDILKDADNNTWYEVDSFRTRNGIYTIKNTNINDPNRDEYFLIY